MAEAKQTDKKIALTSTQKTFLAGAGGALVAMVLVLGSASMVRAFNGHGRDGGPRGGAPMMMQGGGMRGGPGLGGKITKIDGNTLTVTGKDDQTITVTVDDNTNYQKEDDDAKLSDLKVGDEIMIRGDVQNVSVDADSIGIRP